jgi:hypothetical protein
MESDKATALKLAEHYYDGSPVNEIANAIVAALEAARDTAFAAGYAAGTVQLKGSGVDVELQRHPDSPYRDCIIDCTGEVPVVRLVLGTLPLTADGCVIGTNATVYGWWEPQYSEGNGMVKCSVTSGVVCAPHACWSTHESAAKAAMEGRTDA